MGKTTVRGRGHSRLVGAICVGLAALAGLRCASLPKPDPEQSQIRYQLAVGYYRDRRVEAAVEELEKALKADPDNADAYNMLGIIALRQGNDYLVQVETAACLRGQDAVVVREDAQRKFREAEDSIRKAVGLRPEFSNAWNNLAVAALQLHEWDEAISAAQNALKDATYNTPEMARANLGWAHFQKKEMLPAWKELHEAVARSPGFCVGRYRLAKVHLERGELDSAAEEADAVVANKQCPIQEAYLLAGLVHERRRERERARALFESCTSLAPRSCLAEECRRYGQLIQ
jgi:type IV pilus assembly protein PilF